MFGYTVLYFGIGLTILGNVLLKTYAFYWDLFWGFLAKCCILEKSGGVFRVKNVRA